MAKHTKGTDYKKTIGIVVLATLLLLAVGIIAYQLFYPSTAGPNKEASFAQNKTTTQKKTSKNKPSESTSTSTEASSQDETASSQVSTAGSWTNLTDKGHEAIYVQWINNEQGKFDLYTGENYRIYLVNVGANGVTDDKDPVEIIQNTARVQVNADGTYYLQVPDATQTGLRMMQNPWPAVHWQTKETLTGAELFARYGSEAAITAATNQIQSVKNTLVPTQ